VLSARCGVPVDLVEPAGAQVHAFVAWRHELSARDCSYTVVTRGRETTYLLRRGTDTANVPPKLRARANLDANSGLSARVLQDEFRNT
jgi:hypothetical protein